MKSILLSLFGLFPFFGFSQGGQILSITTYPASPTIDDSVTVYVELMFNSGGCEKDNQTHSTNGNLTTASAHHCVGMLTVMCHVTDTFELGYLQAGNHQFNFTLSSGSGGTGCSPGIVPDDSEIYNFSVTSSLGIENPTNNSNISFYPNPMNDLAIIKFNGYVENKYLRLEIMDATGRIVFSKSDISHSKIKIENQSFESGIYFYRLTENDEMIATGKFLVE